MLEHHAYLIRAENAKPESVQKFVEQLNVSEVSYITLQNFGIDDVRTLIEKAFVRPVSGDTQLIVVSTKAITVEAQQALLKILEEPPNSTAFLFCLPKTLYVLPTLLSRFLEDKTVVEKIEDRTFKAFTEFIALRVAERISEITNRLAKKDLDWVEQIKTGLLNMLVSETKTVSIDKLALLFWVAEHLQTRGASNKLLLEELALSLD
jgi:DNA polymerase III delta prime subunit